MRKSVQQLDLFGFSEEPPVTQAEPEVKPLPEPPAATADPVVFADARIVVKIKAKPAPAAKTAEVKNEPAEPQISAAQPAPVTLPAMEVTTAVMNVTPEPEPAADKEQLVISQTGTVAAVLKTPGKRGRKSFREIDNEAGLVDVPSDEVLEQKLYYSISEVAGWFHVNTSLLRYWENEFDILKPRKTRKGDRLFRVEDIRNLQLIHYLLRQRKFSIEGARNYLRQNRQQADIQSQLVQSLTKFRSFLLELRANLD